MTWSFAELDARLVLRVLVGLVEGQLEHDLFAAATVGRRRTATGRAAATTGGQTERYQTDNAGQNHLGQLHWCTSLVLKPSGGSAPRPAGTDASPGRRHLDSYAKLNAVQFDEASLEIAVGAGQGTLATEQQR